MTAQRAGRPGGRADDPAAIRLPHLPAKFMSAACDTRRIVAWDRSFLPLDLAFSASDPGGGTAAISYTAQAGTHIAHHHHRGRRAGGQRPDVAPVLILADAALIVRSLAFLPGLICDPSEPSVAR